jgi:hypothetical protein
MKKILRICFLFIVAILFSCEEGFFVNCKDCLTNEPEMTDLKIDIDHISSSPVIINIYEGNLEDSIILETFDAHSSKITREVLLNKNYTLTATYNISGNTYIVVDSATPRVKYDKDQCEDPCYFIYDTTCDLKLKYSK